MLLILNLDYVFLFCFVFLHKKGKPLCSNTDLELQLPLAQCTPK